MKQYKIALMGTGGVGKTSMTTQFTQDIFETKYEPTIEEIHRKVITIDGEQCLLELMDTAGIDQFTQMTDVYIREGHGFILVYSVIDRASFEEVLILHEQIVKGKCSENVPIVLVGNKLDLADRFRDVEIGAAEKIAAEWPHCSFIETSAMHHNDIQNVFMAAVRQIKTFENTKKERMTALRREASKRKKSSRSCVVM